MSITYNDTKRKPQRSRIGFYVRLVLTARFKSND